MHDGSNPAASSQNFADLKYQAPLNRDIVRDVVH